MIASTFVTRRASHRRGREASSHMDDPARRSLRQGAIRSLPTLDGPLGGGLGLSAGAATSPATDRAAPFPFGGGAARVSFPSLASRRRQPMQSVEYHPATRETAPSPVVRAADLTRRYGEGSTAVDALGGVSVDVAGGQLTAVMGPSGSGKS